ncbi:MAG: response regulator [Acidobacteria bacterium]|nr:response regulator [Acidobacteriota bacterium]
MIKPTVLIAEGDPECLGFLCETLEDEGFKIMGASDGEKAIDLLSEIKPDVIVTELMMPSVSGGDLIRYVRKNTALSRVPIVVASTYGRAYESEALKAGATVVLQKPIDMNLLIETIKNNHAC